MERTQTQQDEEKDQPRKTKTKATPAEKKLRAVELQRADDAKVLGEISKMSAITPYAISSQFNIRIGAAKDLLEELERKKVLTSVGGNARIRVYKAVAA